MVVGVMRKVINENLPAGLLEGIGYNMLCWSIPKTTYPAGYHCNPALPVPMLMLAVTKSGYSVHLFCIYGRDEHQKWFADEWAQSTKTKLDMGKACVRFKKLDGVPVEVFGKLLARISVDNFLKHYEAMIPASKKGKESSSSAASTATTSSSVAALAGPSKRRKAAADAGEPENKPAKTPKSAAATAAKKPRK